MEVYKLSEIQMCKILFALPAAVPVKATGPLDKQVELGRMYDDAACRGGRRGDRNWPTIYNPPGISCSSGTARAPDVEAQAEGPVLNPVEIALPSEGAAVAVLESIPEYVGLTSVALSGDMTLGCCGATQEMV